MFKSVKPLLLALFIFYPAFLIAQNDSSIVFEDVFKKIDGFYENGSYDSILIHAQNLLPLVNEASDKSRILLDIGTALFSLGDYGEALNYYQKRLDHILSSSSNESELIGDCYYYLASCHYELSDYDQALKDYKQSLNLTSDSLSFALTLSAMAGIYSEKSDYDNAIIYEQQALQIFAENKFLQDLFKSNNSLASYYYLKENYREAARFAEQAISFLENKEIIHPPTYNNYALILTQFSDFEQAAFYLQKALTSTEKRFLVITQFNQAFLAYKTQDYQKALNDFKRVINIYQKKYSKGHTNIGKAWYYIGKIKAKAGQTEIALQAYQKSLQSLVPDFVNDDLTALPNLDQYCSSHRNLLRTLIAKANTLGMAYLAQEEIAGNDSYTVFQTFDMAIEIAETLRRSYRAEGSQYFLAEETTTLFEQAIKFSYQLYQQSREQTYLEKMFFYIEKSQAPILLQNHLAIEGQVIGGVPANLIQQEKQLAIDITFYQNQQALAKAKKDEAKETKYNDYLLRSKRSLDSLQDNLAIQYPQYYDYQYRNQTVDLANLQKGLANDQLFLQYYSTEMQLYTLVITKETINVLTKEIQPIKEATKNLLSCLQNPLTKELSSQAAFDLMTTSAFQLYEQLVQSALDLIPFSPTKLVLVNNDFLTEIPFEVLLIQAAAAKQLDYLSLNYLVKEYAISYQPSASLFHYLGQQKQHTAPKELLAIAPFSETASPMMQVATRSNATGLPFTKQEVNLLETLFETTALYDDAAKKSTFLDLAKDYQIIHFATHAAANFYKNANAHLLFSPQNDQDSMQHILYNYEIQNLQLKADLAVLGACETGAGKIDKGEGILNLARSFFYTGVPSVIMSKWKINDQSSSLIIEALYKNLKIGNTKEEALQKAKITYLENEADLVTAHPFYWAGLVQLGNANVLNRGDFDKAYFLGISMGVGLSLLLFWQFFLRNE